MGIMSFSMKTNMKRYRYNEEVSVPYGDHVFLYKSPAGVISNIDNQFPSPMGIMSFSINMTTESRRRAETCFRPLWGSCLSLFIVMSLMIAKS